jgi:hypothetical protein
VIHRRSKLWCSEKFHSDRKNSIGPGIVVFGTVKQWLAADFGALRPKIVLTTVLAGDYGGDELQADRRHLFLGRGKGAGPAGVRERNAPVENAHDARRYAFCASQSLGSCGIRIHSGSSFRAPDGDPHGCRRFSKVPFQT